MISNLSSLLIALDCLMKLEADVKIKVALGGWAHNISSTNPLLNIIISMW